MTASTLSYILQDSFRSNHKSRHEELVYGRSYGGRGGGGVVVERGCGKKAGTASTAGADAVGVAGDELGEDSTSDLV